MKTILTCDGFCVGDARIPPFEVSAGDSLGIAFPLLYGAEWNELMQILGGLRPTSDVHVVGRTVVISLPGFQSLEITATSRTILQFAEERGLTRVSAKRALMRLGLAPTLAYRELPLTTRLLLELGLVWDQGAELVLFSTAGLDPCGILAVVTQVFRMLDSTAAIHVFSADSFKRYESFNSFDEVIHCSLLERT